MGEIMKSMFSLSILILACYAGGRIKQHDNEVLGMDKYFTTSIKGLAILTVVWAHVGKQLNVGGIQFVAGVGVALFLICSGYGLELSYNRIGLIGFWKNKSIKVYCPFLIATLVGFGATRRFTFANLLPALMMITANWYLRFLVLYYMLFFVLKKLRDGNTRLIKNDTEESIIYIIVAIFVFIVESLWLSDPTAPFLEARQVFSFPIGVFIAKNYERLKVVFINRSKVWMLALETGICELILMAVTQLQVVKSLPYVISNILALFTCLPLALAVILIGFLFPKLMDNFVLNKIGLISYELFLIHLYVLNILNGSIVSLIIFIFVTLLFAILLHLINKVLLSRFINNEKVMGS